MLDPRYDENRELAMKLELDANVRFRGWCTHEEVAKSLAESDIGLLPYHVCGHWNHTIPNKLFDYMAAGMPVLATNVVPIERIVNACKCGLIFQDNNPDSFADCLELLLDTQCQQQLGKNGVHWIKKKYNWQEDSARIREVLEGWKEN